MSATATERLLDLLPEATAHSNVHGYLFTDEQMLDFARAAIDAFASNAAARIFCDDECVTHCPNGCPHGAPTSAEGANAAPNGG